MIVPLIIKSSLCKLIPFKGKMGFLFYLNAGTKRRLGGKCSIFLLPLNFYLPLPSVGFYSRYEGAHVQV